MGATNTVCKKGIAKDARTTLENRCGTYYCPEHCINSRPLTYISDNPEYDVITSEGFLITKIAISIEQASKAHPYHTLSQTQGTIFEHFWQVWRNEYLTNLLSNLTNSHSHRNIERGQVVLVREDFDKRIAWPFS